MSTNPFSTRLNNTSSNSTSPLEHRHDHQYQWESPRKKSKPTTTQTLIVPQGDSILKDIEPSKVYRNTQVRTLRGSKIVEVEQDLSHVKYTDIEHIIIHIGTNDIDSGSSVSDTCINAYHSLIQKAKECFPKSTIYISSIIHRRNNQYFLKASRHGNTLLKDLCEKEGLIFLQHYMVPDRQLYDNVHLNRLGTALLVRNIQDRLGPKLGINRRKEWVTI
ncbi:uncharacterized protein LOC102803176 [Saccoglossus kowalevskii]|uniref:Uncharacterized protein LOC102803176 n=1 Tax=Saccoglossus kowalevskii TaxID=10224 RepID=A0ABM0MWS0_SACKO|nr:PREDICTED: uncharacterized protein LOC102803176 [Saccoglossus kowalevskii]